MSNVKNAKQSKRSIFKRPPSEFPVSLDVILKELEILYGKPVWNSRYNPIDELIFTVLTQHTSDKNAERAFDALKSKFIEWKYVENADPKAIAKTIYHGGLANQKSTRIKNILTHILNRLGDFNLEFLKSQKLDETRDWLMSLPGVGPKTAAVVMAFSLKLPAMPVDTHIHRVSGRLGLIRKGTTADEAHKVLEEIVKPELRFPLHTLLINHGRMVCRARNPLCEKCPLKHTCPYKNQFIQ